ncbi:MAG: family 20 glycosylhydrolase [Muribaculaceae bacterium]
MKKTIIAIFAGIFACLVSSAASHPVLLPMPQKVEWRAGSLKLPSTLVWNTNVTDAQQHQALAAAVDVLVSENPAIANAKEGKARKAQLVLTLSKADADTNAEAYTLTVDDRRIAIEGATAAALYRGLQTLRQLSAESGSIDAVSIADSPRYSERGVMLDVSRHFFSKEFVKKQIREIAALKMNRLHLHLTDGAGWRIEIKKYPRLTQMAAWRPAQNWKEWGKLGSRYSEEGAADAFGGYYTQDDIRELVAYARAHFITLVPEVEMPSHSEETLAAYPELSCSGKPYVNADFCPGNEQVYTFWRDVLTEVVELFPGTEIHIGGDEAGKQAWKTCPKCQATMKEHNLADVNALQTHFAERISAIAANLGATIVGWDDLMIGGAPKGSTVQIWGDVSKAQRAVRDGHQVILSPGNYLYLDKYQDFPLSQPEAIGGYLPLDDVYAFGAVLDTLQFARPELVRGVEACLWTEYVPTEQRVEAMLYPRLFALSEVGWSSSGNAADFRRRAEVMNHRLAKNGYTPFSLDTEVGQRAEYKTPVEAISVGKPVTYNIPYSKAYVAGGNGTLTDGLCGGWTYSDRRWQGFIDKGRLDVTIDLLDNQDISSVSLHFLQVAGAQVYLPATVEVLISDDGEQFRSINSVQWNVVKELPFIIDRYTWNGKANARYVRVKADCDSEIGGWIFTDEVIVK